MRIHSLKRHLRIGAIILVPLSGAGAQQEQLPEGVTQEMVNAGQEVFAGGGACATCHGPSGEGTPLAPNLTDGEWLNIDGSYEAIIQLVSTGVPEPKQHPAPMPAKGGSDISDEEVRAVAAYVWTLAQASSEEAGASPAEAQPAAQEAQQPSVEDTMPEAAQEAQSAVVEADGVSPALTHVGHVMDAFPGTPDGKGSLPTALAEAEVIVQHAGLAARDTADLDAMKEHAGHVLHAVDPAEEESGPGSGYGLKPAAAAAMTHIELAGKSEGASEDVTTHVVHVAASLRNTLSRADQIIALAKQIRAATDAAEAAALVLELNTLAQQLAGGVDANGDGTIGWQEGEGGLQHAEQHVNLLRQSDRRS